MHCNQSLYGGTLTVKEQQTKVAMDSIGQPYLRMHLPVFRGVMSVTEHMESQNDMKLILLNTILEVEVLDYWEIDF